MSEEGFISQGKNRRRHGGGWWEPLTWVTKGDVDAFAAVWSNNLATMLVCASILDDFLGDKIVYQKIVPGVGISMAFGCIFYMFQAVHFSNKTGRMDICAQPFGINTPGAFAFISSIILPVYFGSQKNADLAWKVGVAANFVQGAVEVVLGAIGDSIQRFAHKVALLTALASIGLAFLFINTFQPEAAFPIESWICIWVVMVGYLSGVRFGPIPVSLVTVVLGTSIAWGTGHLTVEGVKQSQNLAGFYLPKWSLDAAFGSMKEVVPYLGLVFPVALTVSIGTIQCVQLSTDAGDNYDVRVSMLGDGLATMLAAMFGSVFGMTVFIGHPALKNMGAKIAYNWMNAIAFMIVCFTGISGVILKIIAIESLNPILIFIGLVVCADTLRVTKPKHYPAFIIGLGPALCNWCLTQSESVARAAPLKTDVDFEHPAFWRQETTGASLYGLYLLGSGYLLTSLVITSMLIYAIDRTYLKAAAWSLLGGLFSAFGLMHSVEVDVFFHKDDIGWRLLLAYTIVALFFAILHIAQQVPNWSENQQLRSCCARSVPQAAKEERISELEA